MKRRIPVFLAILLALALTAALSALSYNVLQSFGYAQWQDQATEASRARDRARQMVGRGDANWADPALQAALAEEGRKGHFQILLMGPDQSLIYASPRDALRGLDPDRPVSYGTDYGTMGTSRWWVMLYASSGIPVGLRMAEPLSVFLAIALAIVLLTRTLTRPVTALTRASGQLSRREWDVQLPRSWIQELDELAGSFRTMRDSLRSAMDRQAALEAERQRFIASIVHDLRTPLFSIRGYIEGMQKGVARTPEQVDRYLEVCAAKAAQMDRLVDDLFTYSKLDYLEQEVRREPVATSELLAEAVAGMAPQAAEQGVALTFAIQPDTPGVLDVDRHLMGRALDNLLENAIRHTPAGGSVTVEALPGPVLAVTDTGEGIAAEDLPFIFEPLYRADPSRSRQTGGAGLGLAIASSVMKAHGGKLSVISRPGGGTRFELYLPSR